MSDRLLIIVVLLAAIGGTLWYVSDEARVAGLRNSLGMAQPLSTDVEKLEPEAMEAEVARLAALPVPGVRRAEGKAPPEMGALAEAVADCVVDTGAVLRQPKQRARQALMRYLLVFGAVGADPSTPLLEPRFEALTPLLAAGPEDVAKRVAEGKLTAEDAALIADFHATYSNVAHPLYRGLQLYDQTFEALDFQTLLEAVVGQPLALLDCAGPRVLPAPPTRAGTTGG